MTGVWILELRVPGTWLVPHADGNVARRTHIDRGTGQYVPAHFDRVDEDTRALLDLMCSGFEDASLSLWLFDDAQGRRELDLTPEEWHLEQREVEEMESRLRAAFRPDMSAQQREERERTLHDEARRAVKRDKWAAGALPRDYAARFMFLQARSFVYALDTIAQALRALGVLRPENAAIASLQSEFDAYFPLLRDIRNSAHHPEDRVRLKGPWERPIDATVIITQGSLHENRYGITTASGDFGEVTVGIESLAFVHDIVQKALEAFEWFGMAVVRPS